MATGQSHRQIVDVLSRCVPEYRSSAGEKPAMRIVADAA
jgi:hypothetical protein